LDVLRSGKLLAKDERVVIIDMGIIYKYMRRKCKLDLF
jgi:hypothetical protein